MAQVVALPKSTDPLALAGLSFEEFCLFFTEFKRVHVILSVCYWSLLLLLSLSSLIFILVYCSP